MVTPFISVDTEPDRFPCCTSVSDLMNVVDEIVYAVNAFSDLSDSKCDGYLISTRPDRKDITMIASGPIWSDARSQSRHHMIAKVIYVPCYICGRWNA
jgi:hypothetical protein